MDRHAGGTQNVLSSDDCRRRVEAAVGAGGDADGHRQGGGVFVFGGCGLHHRDGAGGGRGIPGEGLASAGYGGCKTMKREFSDLTREEVKAIFRAQREGYERMERDRLREKWR